MKVSMAKLLFRRVVLWLAPGRVDCLGWRVAHLSGRMVCEVLAYLYMCQVGEGKRMHW